MTDREPPRTDSAPADRDWFGGRRWTGIAALAVIIVVLLCVVILLAVSHAGGRKPTATGTGSSSSSPTSPSSSSTDSSLTSPHAALSTTVPSSAPAGVSWSIYQTVALPSLAGAGPTQVDGALATGYAHTPLGALLAVANETYRFVLAGSSQWRAVVNATIAPGPGKQDAIRVLSADHRSGAQSSDAGTRSQIAGYRFVSYAPTDAVIQLVTRDVHGTLQVLPQHVEWSGSDWLLVLPVQPVTPQIAPSLAGFVAWGGV